MNFRPWDGTSNYDLHVGRKYLAARLRAAGYNKDADEGQPKFNGGVVAHRELRLEPGDKLYRFSKSGRDKIEEQLRGEWWFDEDTCIFLWSKSGNTDEGFRRCARSAFAIPDEWSDMNLCVSGTLARSFWAIAGNTARATGKDTATVNPYGIDVRQIFVPGGLKPADFTKVQRVALTRVTYD